MKGSAIIVITALAGWFWSWDAAGTFAFGGALAILWAWWEIDDRLRAIQERLDRMP